MITGMITLENKEIRVSVNPKGAELQSLFDKTKQQEYMWGGDPAFWGKHSPVLFPIVGTVKEDTYYVNERPYKLGRHGFAREMEFAVAAQTATTATFRLESTPATLEKYPYHFRFDIHYSIEGKQLNVSYGIQNRGTETMLFSVGGHPAFRLPIAGNTVYEDYYLLFEKKETTGRWPISKDGLIEKTSVPLLEDTNKLPLKKELFYKDAIVLKELQSQRVSLRSDITPVGFTFDFTGFPYLGIWAAKDADFICIEPWCGIADPVDSNQQLNDKEGINKLPPGELFERTWSVTLTF